MIFYSVSKKGFYDSEIHGDNIPKDCIEISNEKYLQLLSDQENGKSIKWDEKSKTPISVEYELTTEQIIFSFQAAIQARLDGFAQTRNYDSAMSCATYATSSIKKFSDEAQYMIGARDETWTIAYSILADFEAGNIPAPALEDVLSELPELVWPN